MIRVRTEIPNTVLLLVLLRPQIKLGNISPLGQLSQMLHSNKSAMEALGSFFQGEKDLLCIWDNIIMHLHTQLFSFSIDFS